MLFYLSYLKAFTKYADSTLEESTEFIEIAHYANGLTEKANQLTMRAALNEKIDLERLRKDIFETGKLYINKFSEKFRKGKPAEINSYVTMPALRNSGNYYAGPDEKKTENAILPEFLC